MGFAERDPLHNKQEAMRDQIRIFTIAERPDLESALWDFNGFPEFMRKDPTAGLYYNRCTELFGDLVLVAEDPGAPGIVQAKGLAIPLALPDDTLPPLGWDSAIRWGIADHMDGVEPTHVSALEISVRPEAQGRRLSGRMIDAMRRAAAGREVSQLIAPVRPSRKHLEPHTPIVEYAFRTREDGLPADPWLRTHVRLGGEIVSVAPISMTIVGTLEEWREWTGLPFDVGGPVIIEEALVPVLVDLEHNLALYVEPNVWVRHRLN